MSKIGTAHQDKKGTLAEVEGILVERAGKYLLIISVDILRQGVSLKNEASEEESL